MPKSTEKNKGILLQIAQLGHPILRKKAKKVIDIKHSATQKLIDDMLATLMDVDGVGVAAPQVYESLQIFILASHPNPRYPHAPKMKPTPIINPIIISTSSEKVKDWEGCLSIPGIRGLVPRYAFVKTEYYNREGKKVVTSFKDFTARIFQHEYDHIEGIVFLDRLESTRDVITEKEYQKLTAKKKIKKRKL